MKLELTAVAESFPIAGKFTIARGSRTEAVVVRCTLRNGSTEGQGECVPYARYGETVESVLAQIEAMRPMIEQGLTRQTLQSAMAPGAARNAVDCALWDLEAKHSGKRAARTVCSGPARAIETAYTISLAEPAEMAAQAAMHASRPLLKIKVGGSAGDIERMRAVAGAAPDSRLIIDANEGWTPGNFEENMAAAVGCKVVLIEQPLKPEHEHLLAGLPHPVPVCADESLHTSADLERLCGLYDAVNIKLDKTGGLTEAIALKAKARQMGFTIMVGCMVGTSLAMAPAVLLAQDADFADLDGPLLLARDRENGLTYRGSLVSPPEAALWG